MAHFLSSSQTVSPHTLIADPSDPLLTNYNLKSAGARSFQYQVPPVWNSLLIPIHMSASQASSKSNLKAHISSVLPSSESDWSWGLGGKTVEPRTNVRLLLLLCVEVYLCIHACVCVCVCVHVCVRVCVHVCVCVCCNFSKSVWLHKCFCTRCIVDIVSNLYSSHNDLFLCTLMVSCLRLCLLY